MTPGVDKLDGAVNVHISGENSYARIGALITIGDTNEYNIRYVDDTRHYYY